MRSLTVGIRSVSLGVGTVSLGMRSLYVGHAMSDAGRAIFNDERVPIALMGSPLSVERVIGEASLFSGCLG